MLRVAKAVELPEKIPQMICFLETIVILADWFRWTTEHQLDLKTPPFIMAITRLKEDLEHQFEFGGGGFGGGGAWREDWFKPPWWLQP